MRIHRGLGQGPSGPARRRLPPRQGGAAGPPPQRTRLRAVSISAAPPAAAHPEDFDGASDAAALLSLPPVERGPAPGGYADVQGAVKPAPAPSAAATVRLVFAAACASTFLAAVGRVSFSVLAVPIQHQFGLTLADMGLLQSAMLVGYVVAQVPAGVIADRLGGPQTLAAGLVFWSLASAAMAAAPWAPAPLAFFMAARAAVGLGNSVMMPGVSAAAAQWFPLRERASRTSSVYAWYSLGTVAGLSLTPALAAAAGWPAAFLAFGGAGAAAGVAALRLLPPLPADYHRAQVTKRTDSDSDSSSDEEAHEGSARKGATHKRSGGGGGGIDAALVLRYAPDLALLCWTHGVIGFGFFVLQAWVPTFLHTLGATDLRLLGAISALPWLVTAAVAAGAGAAADALQAAAGWPALRVRRALQTAASLGGAAAFLPLALAPPGALSLPAATAALCVAVGAQGFYYGGFHAYVGDVAPGDAGLILGITNTFSILAGIVGNVVAGALAGGAGGFGAVFGLAAALHAASAVTWLATARGRRLRLTAG